MAKTSSKNHSHRSTQTTAPPSSNSTVENVDNMNVEFYHLNASENDSVEKRISLRQRRGPCSCLELNCGCCAGMEFQKFKRKRELYISHREICIMILLIIIQKKVLD